MSWRRYRRAGLSILWVADCIIVKDVPIVAPVRKPDLLRSLIDQLAARTAQELNISRLCNAVEARKETVGAWLDILERVCMIHRLPSWASSGVKQGVHWPKLHFLDTAKSLGFVVYLGHELLMMGPGRVCLPLSMFWSFS
jgi:predicted AAA+ superfamily ATPase